MTIDVTALVFPIIIVAGIVVFFSRSFTKNEEQEFWLDFVCFVIITAVAIIFIPEGHFSIALRMIVLILLWFTVGVRFAFLFDKKIRIKD